MGIIYSLLDCPFGRQDDVHSSIQGASIEDLPEDIILSVMSKLSFKDVVKFSTLIKQWSNVPASLDAFFFDKHISEDPMKFVNIVNQFMQHYIMVQGRLEQPLSLRSFSMVFVLSKDYFKDIDSWIATAFRYGVTSLTLYFQHHCGRPSIRPNWCKYFFPWHLLDDHPSVLKRLALQSCFFRCRLTSIWTSLEILYLFDTPLIDDDLNIIVHCFPNLRKLAIHCCRVSPKLVFENKSLTDLKVEHCQGIKEIEVTNAIMLAKFSYYGQFVPLKFIRTPKLRNLVFSPFDIELESYVFRNLHEDFPSMRTLSIFRVIVTRSDLSYLHGKMGSFLLLEKLKLYIYPECIFSLETMKEILKACPVLERLEIISPCKLKADAENNIKSRVPYFHKCLTSIKISGFCGSSDYVELVKFLVQVSNVLQHVVIQQKVEVESYPAEHCVGWHGEQDPECIKDILLKLTRSSSLTSLISVKLIF